MSSTHVFLFGTLRHAPLLRRVAGRELEPRPAHLTGARVEVAQLGDWPVLVDAPGEAAEGLLLALDAETLGRLDYYEAVFGYRRAQVTVLAEGEQIAAQVWRPEHVETGRGVVWDISRWATDWAALTELAADDIIRRFGRQPASEVAAIHHVIRSRAAAVLRTQRWQRPARIGSRMSPADVGILRRTHPYDGFFGVEEIFARHRRFDGTEQPEVKRAVFRVTDAATVLPYDPVRDRVLFVEQLRFGPLAQGDPSPWLLEPVAGLIDAGETPEEAAHRETAEEAGLALEDLHFVSRYYPSPGGVSQVLYSYVGIADLSDDTAKLGGHDDEDEDIMGHVVAFEDAMRLLELGDLVNAPAIISLQWLAVHRDRLRATGA